MLVIFLSVEKSIGKGHFVCNVYCTYVYYWVRRYVCRFSDSIHKRISLGWSSSDDQSFELFMNTQCWYKPGWYFLSANKLVAPWPQLLKITNPLCPTCIFVILGEILYKIGFLFSSLADNRLVIDVYQY